MSHYLNHVTLATGDISRSPRSEAADDAVEAVAGLVRAARDAGRADLIGPAAHCSLTVAIDGNALLATISAPAGPHEKGKPYAGTRTMPLVTAGVPRRSTAAPKLWEIMLRHAGVTGLRRPPAPWVAVQMHPTLMGHLDATAWLGDLERLIAWAWIEDRI